MRRYLFSIIFLWSSLVWSVQEQNDFIILPKNEVHQGDYFTTGSNIEISGVVKGDVYIFGSHLVIDGRVEGDVIASGGTIEIVGEVTGNVRLASGRIQIDGNIGRNITAVGGTIQFGPEARIQGNAIIVGGMVDLNGNIEGSANLTASDGRILGSIRGDVKGQLGSLRLGPRARVGGNLDYSSSEQAMVDPEATIGGKVIYHRSVVQDFLHGKWVSGFVLGSKIIGTLMHFLFTFVIGVIFLKVFPQKLQMTLVVLKTHPWKALGMGVLVLVLLPIACIILFITILGFPLALALLAFSLLGFYAAKIFPIVLASNALFTRLHWKSNSLGGFTLGLIIFFALARIPFFGGLLSLVFTLLGLGALVLARISRKKI